MQFLEKLENVRKHTDIKLIKTERRRNHLVSKPKYHNTKFLTENVFTTEMKKNKQILMNKPVYLRLSTVIASAKSWSVRGPASQSVFMSSCPTISHMCLPCLPSGRVSPSISGVT